MCKVFEELEERGRKDGEKIGEGRGRKDGEKIGKKSEKNVWPD